MKKKNKLFKLEKGLSINELEERYELSVASFQDMGFEAQKKIDDDIRCTIYDPQPDIDIDIP